MEVELEQLTDDWNDRLRKLQYRYDATGLEDSIHFSESRLPVFDVAESECHGHESKVTIRKGQRLGVGLRDLETRICHPLLETPDQHWVAKVRGTRFNAQPSPNVKGQISSPGAEVEAPV